MILNTTTNQIPNPQLGIPSQPAFGNLGFAYGVGIPTLGTGIASPLTQFQGLSAEALYALSILEKMATSQQIQLAMPSIENDLASLNGQWIPGLSFTNNVMSRGGYPLRTMNPTVTGVYPCGGELVGMLVNSLVRFTDKTNEIRIDFAVTGLKRDQIDVTVLGNSLRIEFVPELRSVQNETKFVQIPLPLSIDVTGISATYKDDVLSIIAPRQKEVLAKMKKVKIA